MPYRTLVIAPKTNLLLVDDEVQQVVNLLGAKLLQGTLATVHGLLAILRDPFDIIWFATHGDESGVYLADGILNISEITSMVRSAGAQLTVFNTCSSRPVALTIHDEIQTEFVCTLKQVPDRMAFITGTIFAQKIADGMDFFTAYEAAKPGQNSTYTYIGERGNVMPPREPNRYDFNSAPQMPDPQTLLTFIESVKDLNLIVKGSSGLLPPIRDMIKDLQTQVTSLQSQLSVVQSQIAVYQNRRVTRDRVLVAMGMTILILLVLVYILIHRLGGI